MINSTETRMGLAIDWATSSRPMTKGAVSGDVHVVRECEAGVLMAAVDGAGHGQPAREAALVAARILEAYAGEATLTLMARCHEGLTHTRGASATLVWFRILEDRLDWLGVGNVEARLIRAQPNGAPRSESILLQGGILGYRLPLLRPASLDISPRDVLVLATDGIHANFAEDINPWHAPARIAADIMNRHWKGNDDALVVVARYLGVDE
ncbi:MAG TPA: SpoIIE family protein phosphatase [Candidatus Acidoferrum sp.]|nr:SpoIIE family protein phosphatase [Candidatus Acidoferrum sp.]